jgi:peptidoglycan/LPS O-acetylase OafA/YrhL
LVAIIAAVPWLISLILDPRGSVFPAVAEVIIIHDLLTALVFAWVVSMGAQGFNGTLGRLLQTPTMRSIGRISYAMYVFHVFAGLLCRAFLMDLAGPITVFVASIGATIAAATLSWRCFEGPINSLKTKFPY